MPDTLPPRAQLPLLACLLVKIDSAAVAVRTVLRWLLLCLALAGPVVALGPTIVPDMLRCWMLLGDFAPTLAVSTRTTASAAGLGAGQAVAGAVAAAGAVVAASAVTRHIQKRKPRQSSQAKAA